MSEETKTLVKEILSTGNPKPNGGMVGTSTAPVDIGMNLMEELDQKEANEILVRSSPMEVCALSPPALLSLWMVEKLIIDWGWKLV